MVENIKAKKKNRFSFLLALLVIVGALPLSSFMETHVHADSTGAGIIEYIPKDYPRTIERSTRGPVTTVDITQYTNGGYTIPTTSGTYQLTTGGVETIITGGHGISVPAGFKGTIILDNLKIKVPDAATSDTSGAPAAMMVGFAGLNNGNNSVVTTEALILLKGDNLLFTAYDGATSNAGGAGKKNQTQAAGLEVWKGAKITIDDYADDGSTGYLKAQSTVDQVYKDITANGSGAGIGAGNRPGSGGRYYKCYEPHKY